MLDVGCGPGLSFELLHHRIGKGGHIILWNHRLGIVFAAHFRKSDLAIPEIIEDGVTGFICDNLDGMVAAIDRLPLIRRQQCRDSFKTRFTVERMVQDYLAIYQRMAATVRPMVHVNGRSSRLVDHRRMPSKELVLPHIGSA